MARFQNVRPIIPILAVSCSLAVFSTAHSAPAKPTAEEIEQSTRLQIFLDNANFGPGKIDGRGGEFTRKAMTLYREAQGLPPVAEQATPEEKTGDFKARGDGAKKKAAKASEGETAMPVNTEGLDLSSVEPVFTEYQITEQDAANVGELPTGPAEKAKLKALPYSSLEEAVAERFHSDVDFIKELNPNVQMKAGAKVKVPNVKPFDLAAVKQIQPGSGAAVVIANELGEESAPLPEPTPEAASSEGQKKGGSKAKTEKPENTTSADEKASAPKVEQMISLIVSTKDNMVEVYAGPKLTAAFPVTIGSSQTASPLGDWKVKAVAKMPTFRYDKSMLEKGERSSNFHMLPPGPNSPVGVMWIALNKKGIGLHGTDDPDTIGRASSHGCIRLANWDVVKLAELVKSGVAVKVE